MAGKFILKEFSNINLDDHFFDSLKRDYEGFVGWYNKKASEGSTGNNVTQKWLKDNGCWPDTYPAGVPLKPEIFEKVLKEGKIDVQNDIID